MPDSVPVLSHDVSGNISFMAVGATAGGNIISVAVYATGGGNIISVAFSNAMHRRWQCHLCRS